MRAYLYPISTALLGFPIIALLLTIPYMIYSYRRYGSVSIWRSAVLFSFLFYLLCAYFLVILPLPDPKSVASSTEPYAQLVPFTFVRRFLAHTSLSLEDPGTYIGALKQSVLFQPLFNVFLMVPFGVYLSYYFKQRVGRTVLFTFLLSLFFELTQLTGLYGIYPRPYRLFDVDDLMLNTLGGYLGYWIGSRAGAILPTKRTIDEDSLRRSEHVSYTRRALAFALDYGVLLALLWVVDMLTDWPETFLFPLVYFAYFVGIQSLLRGKTIGKMVVRIRVIRIGTRAPLPLLLMVKYLGIYLLILYVQMTSARIGGWVGLPVYAVLFSYAAIGVLLLIDTARSFGRDKRPWYEMISKTMNVSYLDVEKLLKARQDSNG